MCWRSKRTFRSKWPKRAHDDDILNFQPSEWESSTTHTTTHLDLLRGGTKINIDCLFKFNTAFTCTVVKIILQYESIFIFKSYCTVVLWVEQWFKIGGRCLTASCVGTSNTNVQIYNASFDSLLLAVCVVPAWSCCGISVTIVRSSRWPYIR